MPHALLPITATVCAVALLFAGCQSEEDGASAPSAGAVTTAQEANSAIEALSLSSAIATDALLSAGSGTTVTTSGSETATSTTSLDGSTAKSASTFSFAVSGTVTVDLDQTLPGGGDRYPNATGTFSVAYDSSGNGGPVIGTPGGTSGLVAYDVTVTAVTPCTFTDPRCGAATTIAAGSSYTYEVEIGWNRTDATTWSMHSDTRLSSSGLSGSGARAGVTWSASLSGTRRALNQLSYANNALTVTRTVTGDWTVNTVRNGVPHTVIWHRPALDRIFITVDGTTYGPYTLGQVWWWWQVSCH
jgi:hypothetical protein